MTTTPAVLAIDVGGTSMKGAVVTRDGRPVVVERWPTDPATDIVAAIAGHLRSLAGAAREQDLDVVGAGVVTPGMLDEASGTVVYASNLDWRDVPLRALLAEATGLPVVTGHDVRTAGLAEQLLGAARGVEDFVLVTIGTGVAAALVTDGRPVTGDGGAAGELGHIPMVPGGEACTCGQRGCLEVYASGAGLARRYAALSGVPLPAEDVVARLGADPDADRVWAEAMAVLAQGLVTATLLLDPTTIVLGGGFTAAGDALLEPLRSGLAAGLAWRSAPPVRVAELGSEAGWIGAAALAFRHAGHADALGTWTPHALLGAPIP
ncbi:ROK family protein [Modestobacter sp. VKM Ac-2979]|uniref:ROK family protein n=1 Tax=unclassified Modestobacter TaxID=2643866 RepID=UPI0022ABA92A|nr:MULTISPECIES: ROK family protein [unclassified Modestobacter]MCZ2813864.1 ROK family protein [Modestobacter sp. VKM Ac-2979]MCZ2844161.1 ROK family protein [Modestobacter sp. VKM Ac-2980]